MTEAEIFAAAIKLTGDARQAFLKAACGPDARNREQVEALLKAHAESGGLLPKIADADRDETREITGHAVPGVVIAGRYKLLEQIGEGGMGTVWVAEQSQPVKRKVALKLIKAGMDSKSVLARFEAERQALALMDHPNIAKVLDGGLTETGRPYFVMDYVKGVPITEYCDATRLSVRDRLQLFVQVCQAVQHAHQKGIIHRDLKPSNILVAPYDDKPVPKVIDFGLAKAVNQSLTEKTLHTAHDMVLGTPQYMSPEQATFNNLDIDTRSDVYSLGTLLYELLAGSPPFAQPELEKRGLLEILRVVREEDPPRPSLKLSTAAARASISANRGSEPLQLTTMMHGELDWIVMRALEKDRTRRYESANGFAADIQRYLAGEQVQAVPPSLGYRLKKAYRRNRAVVLVGTAFTALIVSAAIVGGVLAVQARRAEALAEAKRIEAEEQTKKAEQLSASNSALTDVYLDAAQAAEIRNNSARLDADLLEYKSDPRVGLLRLSSPLKTGIGPLKIDFPLYDAQYYKSFTDDPGFIKLREFQTAAVITAGQKFVPLVPPIEDDDAMVTSPDGRMHLTGLERTGLKLVAIPSLDTIAIVREANERLVRWGFSPDSQTVWTLDTESIFRFWNVDGSLRSKTPQQSSRFAYPPGLNWSEVAKLSSNVHRILVSDGVAVLAAFEPVGTASKTGEVAGLNPPVRPICLFSTRTGQLIRRIDRPEWRVSDIKLAANDRWIIYQDERYSAASQQRDIELVFVSATDGIELARLVQPGPTDKSLEYDISPSGKLILTRRGKDIQFWNSANWTPTESDGVLAETVNILQSMHRLRFVTDEVLFLDDGQGISIYDHSIVHLRQPGLWTADTAIGISWEDYSEPISELDGAVIRCGRVLIDSNTFQRLNPPVGHKYSTELANLAPDGRFFENLDTVTEKELTVKDDINDHFTLQYLNGFGQIVMLYDVRSDCQEIRIVPDASRLNVPPAMLELWAKVVTGGQLTTDGRFEAWDEPTWQAKQKELAAMKPPYEDFPFPGWVATEPHLWWRIKAYMTQNSEERKKLLNEWRHRSGRVRPEPQPDTWRTPGPDPSSEQSLTTTLDDPLITDANKQP